MAKIGVFLARMQPLHNGHLYVIDVALSQVNILHIILGSADKSGIERNPIDVEDRAEYLRSALIDKYGADVVEERVQIHELDDWSTEDDYDAKNEWGKYLYYNIVSRARTQNFHLYFSDNPSVMLSWFDNDLRHRINFTFLEREYIEDGISATKIRKAIHENNHEFVKKYCPAVIVNNIDYITKLINRSRGR